MVITRTPFRVSFFGGGTDYPAWYKSHGGMVINTSIDKYCYITSRHLPPFFDHKYRIRYTRREEKNNINDIEHPSVRECMRYMDYHDYLEMLHASDLPAMSGLGSSSAFTVGFLHSLHGLTRKPITKKDLALLAIHVEQGMIKENVGSQDQIATAIGGFNSITFDDTGIHVTPIPISDSRREALERKLLLFFVGFQRNASEVAGEQIKNIPNKTAELTAMSNLAQKAKAMLSSNDNLDEFGSLLDEGWNIKKTLSSKITSPSIDKIYEDAKKAGAVGGKLLGAGGGGFMAFYAPENKHDEIKATLSSCINVPFHFENAGSQIIYEKI